MIVYDTLTYPTGRAVDFADVVNSDLIKIPDYGIESERKYIEDVLIPSSCDDAEKYLNRKLVYQKLVMRSDAISNKVFFPYGNLRSVESIVIYDMDNAPNDQDGKFTVIPGERGIVFLNDSESWDCGSGARSHMPFEITFFCGWDKENVPTSIRDMILSMVAYRYYNRETTNIPTEILSKGNGYRIMRIT
jgi:hypothetical protein